MTSQVQSQSCAERTGNAGRRSFGHDQRGTVAVLFALTLIPLVGLVGAAVDYSRATATKAALDAGLDAGLIAAANSVKDAGTSSIPPDIVEKMVRDRAIAHVTLENLTVNTETFIENGQSRRAVATYDARLPTAIIKAVGLSHVPIRGRTEVMLDRPSYTDIHLIMDVSASMGLAADDAGRQLLATKTREINGEECTFACHVKGHPSHPKTNTEIALEYNIRTRIDITQSVTATLLDDVKVAQDNNVYGADVYRVGLYSFSGSGVHVGGAKTLTSPTSALQSVRPSITALQLDDATAYKPMLADMTKIIGTSLDGSSPDNRRKFAILFTDGADYGHNWDWSSSIDPADCEALKRNGVKLYVFNTKWVADFGNWAFDPILGYKTNRHGAGTVFNALGPKLRECSSGDAYYFEGTDAAEISTNFRKIFRAIHNSVRISRY